MQLKESKLISLAQACWNGACNPHGIINSLPEAMREIEPGTAKQNVPLKIIIGQIAFLIGESIGPSDEAVSAWQKIEAN